MPNPVMRHPDTFENCAARVDRLQVLVYEALDEGLPGKASRHNGDKSLVLAHIKKKWPLQYMDTYRYMYVKCPIPVDNQKLMLGHIVTQATSEVGTHWVLIHLNEATGRCTLETPRSRHRITGLSSELCYAPGF
jgi:hypothetical protein